MTPAKRNPGCDTCAARRRGSDTLRRMATVKQAQPKDLNLDDAPGQAAATSSWSTATASPTAPSTRCPRSSQTVDGFPTNALLGMANMLMKLLADYRPATVLVAWDEKPTARIELAPEYKAHRRPMPDLLRQQLPYFQPIVEAFGYRNFRVEGKEADDVIGTLATKAEAAGHTRVRRLHRPRRLPARLRQRLHHDDAARGGRRGRLHARPDPASATASAPSSCPTSSASRATPPTTSPACPASATRRPPSCWCGSGRWRASTRNLDAVSGEKRRENLRTATEDAARSKQLATIDRDARDRRRLRRAWSRRRPTARR